MERLRELFRQYFNIGQPDGIIPVDEKSIFAGKSIMLSDEARQWLDFSKF